MVVNCTICIFRSSGRDPQAPGLDSVLHRWSKHVSPTKGSQKSASWSYKCTSWDFRMSLQLWIAVSDERCYWWKNASAETVFGRGLRTTDRDDRWSPKVDEITQEECIEWEGKGEDWTWQNNGERRGTWWQSQEYHILLALSPGVCEECKVCSKMEPVEPKGGGTVWQQQSASGPIR